MKRKNSARPRMTAEEARDFQRMSEASMIQLFDRIAERAESGDHVDCNCQPYDDIFTLPRWNALGYRVIKGESSLKVGSFAATTKPESEGDAAADQARAKLRPVTLRLFCRCQVTERPSSGQEATK